MRPPIIFIGPFDEAIMTYKLQNAFPRIVTLEDGWIFFNSLMSFATCCAAVMAGKAKITGPFLRCKLGQLEELDFSLRLMIFYYMK